MQDPVSNSKDHGRSEIKPAALSEADPSQGVSEPLGHDADSFHSPKQQPATATPAAAKPWGGWGGWGSISTTLTGIAAATAKDLSDLSSNLQNVIVLDPADVQSPASSPPAPLAARDGRDASLVGAQDLLELAEPCTKSEDRDLASAPAGQVSLMCQIGHDSS